MPGQVKGGNPAVPGHMAEKGVNCCRTAGAQEGVVMGMSSGRGTKKETGHVQNDCRMLLQRALRKCWNMGQWSHLAYPALRGFFSCIQVAGLEGGVLFISII